MCHDKDCILTSNMEKPLQFADKKLLEILHNIFNYFLTYNPLAHQVNQTTYGELQGIIFPSPKLQIKTEQGSGGRVLRTAAS